MGEKKNILICPLEWGLGHATRMIPIARELQERNYNVFIGGGDDHLSLFRNEVPGLSYIKLKGFNPGYSRKLPQYLYLLLNIPLLLYHIIREHYLLKEIIRENDINVVISDNRFGLWNKNIKTVYITHMPLIPFPKPMRAFEFIGILLHRAVIKKYSYCFIPDLPGELNVSGRLSHGMRLPQNVRYIGILSRFISLKPFLKKKSVKSRYSTVILSGPEPQKGILKDKLVDLFKDKEPGTVILAGRPGDNNEVIKIGNIILYNHLPSREMREILTGSEMIITRSGYSSIMDLISLNCSAILIPTPGQTEQEYLAEHLSEKGWFSFIKQHEIKKGITLTSQSSNKSAELIDHSKLLLKRALKELMEDSQTVLALRK